MLCNLLSTHFHVRVSEPLDFIHDQYHEYKYDVYHLTRSCHKPKRISMTLADTIGKPRASLRAELLLNGPVVSTLFRLSWPNIIVMLAQTSTGLVETWWISHLGTDALAGMAVVFPVVMLMQMMSQGAMGAEFPRRSPARSGQAGAARQTPSFSIPSSSTSSSVHSSRSPFSCSDLPFIVL